MPTYQKAKMPKFDKLSDTNLSQDLSPLEALSCSMWRLTTRRNLKKYVCAKALKIFLTDLKFFPSPSGSAPGSTILRCCSLRNKIVSIISTLMSITCPSLQQLGPSDPSPAMHLHTPPTCFVSKCDIDSWVFSPSENSWNLFHCFLHLLRSDDTEETIAP